MPESRIVMFRNFSNEEFIGVWNKEEFFFKPNQSMYMEDWMAQHFAKHLANRELLRAGKENDTSPKKPMDNPRFMEMFNKAYIVDSESEAASHVRARLNMINLQHKKTKKAKTVTPMVNDIEVENDDKTARSELQTPVDNDDEEFEGLAEVKWNK